MRAVRAGLMAGAAWVALGGCFFHRPAPGGFRRYYLAKKAVQGNLATSACERGFHMASRFEILDVTRLEYASELGFTTDDSGDGPPSRGAQPNPPGGTGWIRTGGDAQYTAAKNGAESADTNCAAWVTNSPEASGTVAALTDRFVPSRDPTAVWTGGPQPCDREFHVWCVEDAEVPEPRFFARERRRGRESRE